MAVWRNPLFEEGIRVYLGEPRRARLLAAIPITLLLVTLMAWPKRHFSYFLTTGSLPAMYEVIVYASLAVVLMFTLRYGIQGGGESPLYAFREWLLFAEVPWVRVLAGKVAFALVHSLTLVSLTLPFLVVAGAVGGIPLLDIVATAGLLLLCSLSIRLIGLLFLALFERRRLLLYACYWLVVLLLFLATQRVLPALNPIVALYGLIASTGEPSFARVAEWYIALAVCITGLSAIRLRRMQRGRDQGGAS